MFIALDELTIQTRATSHPVFVLKNKNIDWGKFYQHIASLQHRLSTIPVKEWLIYCEDSCCFAIALLASLHTEKTITLLHNAQSQTIKELTNEGAGLITDLNIETSAPKIQISLEDNIDGYNHQLPKILNAPRINFLTSGSTGKPQKICKTLEKLLAEICELEKLWGSIKQQLVISTVSHQHIYGMLFKIFWPLCRGDIIYSPLVFTPEELNVIISQHATITMVSSPAFLRRLTNSDNYKKLNRLFSSGGKLPENTAQNAFKLFHCPVTEILGSTETGGIAYRNPGESPVWQVFDPVKIKQEDGQLSVKSPYISGNDFITTGDIIELIDSNHFILKDRIGRIVKIEEKRVSLSEIETRLGEHQLVQNCYSLILQENRQIIGVAIVLTEEGKKLLLEKGKNNLNKTLRQYLSNFFEPVVIPRKWRYVSAIITNSLGKISLEEMEKLFNLETAIEP